MIKHLIVMFLILTAWSNQAVSDDIDLYIKNTAANVQRPSVLIILDNSPSMVWYPVDSDTRLGIGNEHVNNPNTRAHIAREIVIDLINENPGVDFGLQLFNSNSDSWHSPRHGGRIVFGLKDLSIPANKADLISILDNDNDNTNNNYTTFNGNGTPLCEALYETYRYLSGGDVYYGNHDTSTPQSIKASGAYTSPFAGIQCDKEITIIYITDGDPTIDDNADGLVKLLTGAVDADAENGNFLGVLGNWMGRKNWLTFNNIEDTPEGDILASVKIHTVGFTGSVNATNLLKLAARDGVAAVAKPGFHDYPAGGRYYPATTAADLKTALQEVVEEVLQSSSFTSASVSANSYDPTQTSDAVYYGMFEPSTAARWQGNLKKYKIVNGDQVDALGNPAVDATGEFDEDSKSYWSPTVDGNDVNKGGVAEMLRTTAIASRKLLTDINGVGTLTAFNLVNINAKYSTPATLASQFGIPLTEVLDVPEHVSWAMGIDVDDDDNDNLTNDVRPSVFGDPLHSKPIVINYGTGNPRIVIGTNAGVLHMFEDDEANNTVKENWAYLPNEFFKNIKPLRENVVAVDNKIYGLDGEITLYINDLNNNGIVDSGNGDTAWLFFGVRRGGRSYYALDVTTPGAPKLMWYKDFKYVGFEKLGQTWSKPQVVRSAYNSTDADKLVVIFGGGYDVKKDASGPNAVNDDTGASIYMVNARTGAIILNQSTGIKNGIASSIAGIDSDGDALVDRLYVGDTGGNVWRVDMPDDSIANTSIIRLANLSGTTNAKDIRFFNKPSIVRTYLSETINAGTIAIPRIVRQEVPYDAVLLGSGDRTTPTDTDTDDKFFMIKDKYIKTQRLDNLVPTVVPITINELYDFTDNPFEGYPTLTTAQEAKLLDASLASGWYIDLDLPGEKNTAEAIVLNNVVYFTTYTPTADTLCSVTPGDASLYAMDLALGVKKYDWGTEVGNRDGDDRILVIGSGFPGKPTYISTLVTDQVTGDTTLESKVIVGKLLFGGPPPLQTMRTSLTIQEN